MIISEIDSKLGNGLNMTNKRGTTTRNSPNFRSTNTSSKYDSFMLFSSQREVLNFLSIALHVVMFFILTIFSGSESIPNSVARRRSQMGSSFSSSRYVLCMCYAMYYVLCTIFFVCTMYYVCNIIFYVLCNTCM